MLLEKIFGPVRIYHSVEENTLLRAFGGGQCVNITTLTEDTIVLEAFAGG